jgi:uncharacterized protein (UPF0276 family)
MLPAIVERGDFSLSSFSMIKTGIGFRRELKQTILEYHNSFDCLEIISEQFLSLNQLQKQELAELASRFILIPHGLSLSIGSVSRPSQSYLDSIAYLLEIIQPPYYSDHFAITGLTSNLEDIDIGHLSPLWYTEEALEVVIKNIQEVQSFLGIQLVLETITHPFNIPYNSLSQGEFISKVQQETNCGILLDITNIFINAQNLGGLPEQFIDNLPKDAIKQLHIVGYAEDPQGFLLDTHSTSIQKELWELYKYAVSVCQPEFVIIERDEDFPTIDELLRELQLIRQYNLI